MSQYDAVVKMWQNWNIRTVDDLALRLRFLHFDHGANGWL